jgi:hypothetical protein
MSSIFKFVSNFVYTEYAKNNWFFTCAFQVSHIIFCKLYNIFLVKTYLYIILILINDNNNNNK